MLPGQLAILGFAPTGKPTKLLRKAQAGGCAEVLPHLGSHGESLFSLTCLWSRFVYMALVLQFGQPVRAQPLPGLCQGRLVQTNSCGKFSAVCFVCGVAGKQKRPQEKWCLSCSVLLGRSPLAMWWGNCNIESLKGRAEGP